MKTNGESKARRQFSAETKLQILKEGRTTHLTISQVCDRYGPAAQTYIRSVRPCFISGSGRPTAPR